MWESAARSPSPPTDGRPTAAADVVAVEVGVVPERLDAGAERWSRTPAGAGA